MLVLRAQNTVPPGQLAAITKHPMCKRISDYMARWKGSSIMAGFTNVVKTMIMMIAFLRKRKTERERERERKSDRDFIMWVHYSPPTSLISHYITIAHVCTGALRACSQSLPSCHKKKINKNKKKSTNIHICTFLSFFLFSFLFFFFFFFTHDFVFTKKRSPWRNICEPKKVKRCTYAGDSKGDIRPCWDLNRCNPALIFHSSLQSPRLLPPSVAKVTPCVKLLDTTRSPRSFNPQFSEENHSS